MYERWLRRIRNITITGISVLGFWYLLMMQRERLQDATFTSGYVLGGIILFLCAYNVRKKLPHWRLGNSATWLQFHIYAGIGSILVFLLHVQFRVPQGRFESILAGLYLVVATSGLYGLFLSRTIPRLLTAIKHEVPFAQIPAQRAKLAQEAQQLAIQSLSDSPVLAKFYRDHLFDFFEQPRQLMYYLRPNGAMRRSLLIELQDLRRYLSDPQRAMSDTIADLIYQKDDIDFHHALQSRMRIWLFVHVGLSYGLVFAGALHGILAHAFHGGLR
jgi:hypothetical protein